MKYSPRIEKAPFVCNGCKKPRNKCSLQTKYDYNAKAAQRIYEEPRTSSMTGIKLTKKRLHQIDRIITPLIEQEQSPYMILTNHPELNLSVTTLYNYINQGILLSRNIDLKRKVKFKQRKCHDTQSKTRDVFTGRSYADFNNTHADELDFWEMNTVKSRRGSLKCILTLYFPQFEFLVGRLMNRCTPGAVRLEFKRIQKALGGSFGFSFLFPVILTDRGVKFGEPDQVSHKSWKFAIRSIIKRLLSNKAPELFNRFYNSLYFLQQANLEYSPLIEIISV